MGKWLVASRLFSVDGTIAVLIGAGFLILPQLGMDLFGIRSNPSSLLFARLLGACLLANGIGMLGARREANSAAGRAITLGNVVFDASGVLITTIAISQGVANPAGLSITLLLLGFGAWRIYLLLVVYRPQSNAGSRRAGRLPDQPGGDSG